MRMQVKQAVIVEGKYDKIKLSGFLDAIILETDGFQIFKDKAKQKLIRRLAEQRGIIVLTDSDSAGFLIRSFLSGITDPKNITNVYIPDIFGKEKRKDAPSAEGKLGVEGVPTEKRTAYFESCVALVTETGEEIVASGRTYGRWFLW